MFKMAGLFILYRESLYTLRFSNCRNGSKPEPAVTTCTFWTSTLPGSVGLLELAVILILDMGCGALRVTFTQCGLPSTRLAGVSKLAVAVPDSVCNRNEAYYINIICNTRSHICLLRLFYLTVELVNERYKKVKKRNYRFKITVNVEKLYVHVHLSTCNL